MGLGREVVSGQEELNTRPRASRRPLLMAIIRTVQLGVGFITLVLTALAAWAFSGDFYHTFTLTLTSFVWTILLLIFIFVIPRWLPKFDFYLCHLILEIITFLLWLSSFSLLVWECMDGDETFAVLGESMEPTVVAYVTASGIRSAIVGLKVAIALACINWITFAATLILMKRPSI